MYIFSNLLNGWFLFSRSRHEWMRAGPMMVCSHVSRAAERAGPSRTMALRTPPKAESHSVRADAQEQPSVFLFTSSYLRRGYPFVNRAEIREELSRPRLRRHTLESDVDKPSAELLLKVLNRFLEEADGEGIVPV